MGNLGNPVDLVLEYHSRTKHHLHRFAASLGYLDWASQPDPFRWFEGAQQLPLPLSTAHLAAVRYADLYRPETVPCLTVNQENIAALFELALGLSAWKQYQNSRWALRCNPSSGNLHPTEGYLIVPQCPGLDAGVYHYLSRDHCLERRCALNYATAQELIRTLGNSFLVGLSSIHWREAWKYGERAFRYCQHDMGHAIASMRYAAGTLGWTAKLLDVSDAAITDLLGLSRDEAFSCVSEQDRECPEAVLMIGPGGDAAVDIEGLRRILRGGSWSGQANVLSPNHTPWPVIDDVARATCREEPISSDDRAVSAWRLEELDSAETEAPLSAVTIIQQRRSAVALDDSTPMPVQTFYRILNRLLPRPHIAPWDVLSWRPHLHCGIFVHRVDGLMPGLYLLERSSSPDQTLRSLLRADSVFERPAGCPKELPFFKLVTGDFRQQAQNISCQQKIAGAGAFSLGMIAEFETSIRSKGAWWYRRLFWEAGVLGHVLYLESEAAGFRGTGIGCYFDDAFHSLLGLKGNQFQSLYHFTVGRAIEDTRLMTHPPYVHLNRS
jgi:SagB-type dehydrogenase family enzyme